MRLDPTEVASRYAYSRVGFELGDAVEVAIPFFWLTIDAIVQERKPLSAVDEFILLGVRAGLDDPSALSSFLGIDERVIRRSLIEQIHADILDWAPGVERRALRLTPRGDQVAAELATIEPKQAPLFVAFDRMTWQVSHLRREDLFRAFEVRDAGIRELPWARSRRPKPAELPVRALDRAYVARGFQSNDEAGVRSEILSVTGVQRAERLFRPAVLLVYRESNTTTKNPEFQLDVIVDGRRSDIHTQVASELGVLLPYEKGDQQDEAAPIEPALQELRDKSRPEAEAARERVSLARATAQTAEAAARGSERPEDVAAATHARNELASAVAQQDQLEVRPLQTWEHPPLLAAALSDAQRRLLLISPWIKGSVVDRDFLESLSRALARRVRVHIGYGITRSPHERQQNDPRAEGELRLLAQAFDNFTFSHLGDTHAKVLIWDDSIIVTSFNWLSFRGARDRTFRQEEGVLVRNRAYTETEYSRHAARIEVGVKESE